MSGQVETGEFKTVINNREASYITVRTGSISVSSGAGQELLSQTETGELLGLEATVSNLNLIIEVVLYGDSNTYYRVNDKSVRQLLERGRGLTVGDVTLLPLGTSPDRRGTPSTVSMFVRRVKDDTIADYFGNTAKTYTVAYEPTVPFQYKAIYVNVRNNSTTTASVTDFEFHRIVYRDLEPGGYYFPTKIGRS